MCTAIYIQMHRQLPQLEQEIAEILRNPHTGQLRNVREFLAHELTHSCTTYSLNQLCELSRGKHLTQAQIAQLKGDYPIYSSATQNNGVIGYVNYFDHDGEALTWTTDGVYAGTVFPRQGKFALTVHCGLIVRRAEFAQQLDYSYLRYYLQYVLRKLVNTSTRQPMLGLETLKKVTVVVPSIKVQRILGIIFDLGVANAASLDAELNLRQLQLSYYRQLLLNLSPATLTTHLRSLGLDLAMLDQSYSTDASCFTTQPLANFAQLRIGDPQLTQSYISQHQGNYPVYSAQTQNSGITGYINTYQQDGEYLTWSLVGYAGRFFYRHGRFNAGRMCGVLQITQSELIYCKYLYQVLQQQTPSHINASSVMPMCNIKHLAKMQIPLPPYELQVWLGDFLYNYESYLTGEIASLTLLRELRQQQLDYYQQSLLQQILTAPTTPASGATPK